MRENAIKPVLVCAKEWAALLATLSLYTTCLSAEAATCVGEGVLGKTITVSGVCEGYVFSKEANGAYELQGTTSDGREYYANAAGNGQYLFYDAECTGALTFPARWMITYLKPNITATEGLVDCQAPGAYLETSAQTLPSNASWQMHNCKYGYEFFSHTLSISSPTCTCKVGYSGENCEMGSAPPACDGEGAVGKQMDISGACVVDGSFDDRNGVYERQGTTADGREYYKKKGSNIYLFYDANCGAEYNQPSPAGWYITTFEPNITATQGLADYPATLNNGCAYGSKFATTATTLPSSGAWQMSCDKKGLDLGGTSDSDSVLSISPPTCICASGYTNCDGTTTTATLTTLTATSTAATAAATITTTTTAAATSVAVISATTSNTTTTNSSSSSTSTSTTTSTTTTTTTNAQQQPQSGGKQSAGAPSPPPSPPSIQEDTLANPSPSPPSAHTSNVGTGGNSSIGSGGSSDGAVDGATSPKTPFTGVVVGVLFAVTAVVFLVRYYYSKRRKLGEAVRTERAAMVEAEDLRNTVQMETNPLAQLRQQAGHRDGGSSGAAEYLEPAVVGETALPAVHAAQDNAFGSGASGQGGGGTPTAQPMYLEPATVGADYEYGPVPQAGTESKGHVYSVYNGSAQPMYLEPATVGADYEYGPVPQAGTESKGHVYSVYNGSAGAHDYVAPTSDTTAILYSVPMEAPVEPEDASSNYVPLAEQSHSKQQRQHVAVYSVPAASSGSNTTVAAAADVGETLYAADVEGYLAVGAATSGSISSASGTAVGQNGGHDYAAVIVQQRPGQGHDYAAAVVGVRAQGSADQVYSVPFAAGEEDGVSASAQMLYAAPREAAHDRTNALNDAGMVGDTLYSSEQGVDA